jgi:DNA (cytosine-5)-methyltransferase 1
MKKVRTISLFSCCGGADYGLIGGFKYLDKYYKKHPVNIVHASDIDEKAVNTYNLNFTRKSIVEDVKSLQFEKGAADLIIGGFPCQAFSTVNPTKNPGSKENQLFWEMANVISQVKPKIFIAENVRGFYSLSKGKYFKIAEKEFKRYGYKVYSDILNASDFGVPQKRERLFMVGVSNKYRRKFIFPEPTHGVNGISKSVLGDVVKSLIPTNNKYYFSKKAVEGVKKAKPNMKRALAQNLNDQCLTITSHLAKVSINSRDPVLLVDASKELYRRFTPWEAARIQSFPDQFQFAGTESDAYRQIGQAIPPVLMWNLFNQILKIYPVKYLLG